MEKLREKDGLYMVFIDLENSFEFCGSLGRLCDGFWRGSKSSVAMLRLLRIYQPWNYDHCVDNTCVTSRFPSLLVYI